jgi:hypothetical protein
MIKAVTPMLRLHGRVQQDPYFGVRLASQKGLLQGRDFRLYELSACKHRAMRAAGDNMWVRRREVRLIATRLGSRDRLGWT